jgi:hypothetical protein
VHVARGWGGTLSAIPGPADSLKGNLIEMDQKAHERAPEEDTHQKILRAKPGVHDPGPDPKAQSHSDANADGSDHITVYHSEYR